MLYENPNYVSPNVVSDIMHMLCMLIMFVNIFIGAIPSEPHTSELIRASIAFTKIC